ncbi:MAG TPA: phosphate signaling complex protein PhoU [Tepidisphaeraceae bacterium]|nr:phosphate signaling complex protein PhoU [Tepidisphaeraceae bacterium]
MAHHFIELLEDLKERVARMTCNVQQIVERACESIINGDIALADQVVKLDREIDSEEVEVEEHAIGLLALHQPAASDLRLVTTIIKVNSDFERIADCAVNVAQRVPTLNADGKYTLPPDVRLMANTVVGILRDTVKAFNLNDESLARQVLRGDDLVDALYHQIVQEMLHTLENDPASASRELANIMIAKNLERIGDHCTNIAEDIVYVHSGNIIRHRRAV